jgi:hypothetical protein
VASQSMPVANAAATTSQRARLPTAGRGIGWSDAELTALVVHGYEVGSDPIVGAGQTAEAYSMRVWAAFLEKIPPGACSATDTKCAMDRRRWKRRQAGACLRKYKDVVRVCTRLHELRKRIDDLHLTGAPTKGELDRIALALFNNVVTMGNRELMYTIATNPDYNVGRFEYAAHYDFLSKNTTLLESGSPTPVQSVSQVAAGTGPLEAENSGCLEPRSLPAERPIGNKAAKRNKRARESLEGSDVATSVREFSAQLKDSDRNYARRAEEKLKLAKESHMLRRSQTLFVHESSTASKEEKDLAEKKLCGQCFCYLECEASAAVAEEDAVCDTLNEVGSHKSVSPRPASISPPGEFCCIDYSDVPYVHGATEEAEEDQGLTTIALHKIREAYSDSHRESRRTPPGSGH